MKKAIVIGASSGIGRELAKVLSQNGYEVGLTGRRGELLRELQRELPAKSHIKPMDIAQTGSARKELEELLSEMGGVELIIINAGINARGKTTWEQEERVLATNATGFAAMASAAMDYFRERGGGHIVGISSVAALKGFGISAAYCSSKAFVSTYMQALRQKSKKLKLNVTVTDIKPGFIDTPMISGRKYPFWVVSAERAAREIYTAIRKRKNHAYVPGRWRLAGWILKAIPDWIFIRLPV